MVEKRKLAIPYTSVFICQLQKKTQELIRGDLEAYARFNGYVLQWDKEANDYVAMTRRFCDIDEIYMNMVLEFCKEDKDVSELIPVDSKTKLSR